MVVAGDRMFALGLRFVKRPAKGHQRNSTTQKTKRALVRQQICFVVEETFRRARAVSSRKIPCNAGGWFVGAYVGAGLQSGLGSRGLYRSPFTALRRTLGLSFLEPLQLLAGLEAHGFSRRNAHLFAGAGIAADAGLARFDAEHPKAAKFDALAAAQCHLERLKNRLHGLLRFGAAHVCCGHHGIYDVQLDHTGLPPIRWQMLEGAPRVVKDMTLTLHWASFRMHFIFLRGASGRALLPGGMDVCQA